MIVQKPFWVDGGLKIQFSRRMEERERGASNGDPEDLPRLNPIR